MFRKKLKKYCLFSLISIFTAISFIIQTNDNNIVSYALSDTKNISTTIMQDTFLNLISMNANNSDLKISDIESILSKFENKQIQKRKIDSVYTYRLKYENLVFIISDNTNKIESIIYKKYNPTKDINMLRAQYSDFGQNNDKYIRLELSSTSIKSIDKISKELNAKFIDTSFYSDYLKIFHKASSGSTLTKDDLVKINPKISEDRRRLNDGTGENVFITINDDCNGLTINTNKLDNKLRFLDVSSSLPLKVCSNDLSKLQTDCLQTQLVSDLCKKDLEYFNLSNRDKFVHTLMLFKESDQDLQKVLLEAIRIFSNNQ